MGVAVADINFAAVVPYLIAVVAGLFASIGVAIGYVSLLAMDPQKVSWGALLVIVGCAGGMAVLPGGGLLFTYIFVVYALICACKLLCLQCCADSTTMAIVNASTEYIAKTRRVVLVPMAYQTANLCITIPAFLGMAAIATLAKPATVYNVKYEVWDRRLAPDALVGAFEFFMVVGAYFLNMFMQYKLFFIMSCSVTSYYFSSSKAASGTAEVMGSITSSFKHIGSFAYGAFLMTLIFILQLLEKMLERALEQQARSESTEGGAKIAIALCLCYLKCCVATCLKCMEEVVDKLNKAAFSYMAITGDDFCTAGKNGFLLFFKHVFHLLLVDFVIGVIQVCGVLCISAVSTLIGAALSWVIVPNKDLAILPTFIVFGLSLLVAAQFLQVMESAVYQLLLCMAIDKELNGGSCQFGPPTFHEEIEKYESANGHLLAGAPAGTAEGAPPGPPPPGYAPPG